MGYMLGIDIGTSSIKVGLFAEDGQLVSITRQEYKLSYPAPGWAEVNPDLWWGLVKEGLREVLSKTEISPEEIYSVGLSTLCPALFPISRTSDVLYPAIIFYDQRSYKEAEEIKRKIPEEVFLQITGNRIIPGASSLTSILWLKNNRPEIYHKTSYFGHGNSYIAYKLTGNFFLDRTNASYMGVFDAKKTFDWRKDLIKELGLSPDKFPPVLLSSKLAGGISLEASKETGLTEGTPVVIGGADTACSSLALGVLNDGDLFESCGTSDVITVCTSQPFFNDKFMNRCHVIDNHWLLHGAMSTPGATIKWLSEELALSMEGNENIYDLIFKEAQKSPPGANGLIFLPYMYGERTPIWDPDARGVFFGLSLNTKRADIYRSVLEGVGFGLRQIMEIINKIIDVNVQEMKIVGGAAQNTLWNQIKADILQVKLLPMEYQETAVLGAAILGGMNVGLIDDIYKFTKKLELKKLARFQPNKRHQMLYDQLYQLYVDLYPLLKYKYKELKKIFIDPHM